MRCSESKNRIIDQKIDLASDKELMDHIKSCHACAQDKDLTEKLSQIMKTAGQDDRLAMTSIEAQQKLVESRIQGRGRAIPRRMPRYRFGLSLGFGFGAVAMTVLLLFLMPFDQNHVTGYEVALKGVDYQLAESDETVCDMLFTLGLDEAAVDITGCDPTCTLKILDLKTKQEADLVVAAFENLNSDGMSANVIPVRALKPGSI